jgi:ABC-type multidrug transport system fused ATPase/permease subunit
MTAGRTSARGLVLATLRRRRQVLAVGAWALVGAVPTFVSGQALARAVDDGFLADRPGRGLAWLGLLAATVPLGAWGARHSYLGVARMAEPLRDDLVRLEVDGTLRRATMPGGGRDTGAVARLTEHVETIRETVASLLLLVLSFVAVVIAALAGLLTLAPAVLPLVVVPLLVSLGAFAASLPALTRQQRKLLLADEGLAEQATEVAEGLRDIVACGAEDQVAADLDGRVEQQVEAGRGLARVAAVRTVVVSIGGQLPVLLVLLSAGWLLRRGLSEGALLGALTYLVHGLEPAVSSIVGGIGAPLAQLAVTIDRIDTATAPPPAPTSSTAAPSPISTTAATLAPSDGDSALVVRGVTFRYRAAAEPVMQDLDLALDEGDHLAVVGPSGAGKSTLAALLVGVLRPQGGTIRWRGQPPELVPAPARVLLPQQAYVFRGSLDENLRYLWPDAPTAAVQDAVAAIGMEPLVERLGGYQTELEPDRLSAGERQLVTLARAYLAPARLLVLDEATCHLDPVAEAVVERAFAARDTTLVVVAHRISSARRAGRILVMDGRETAMGTHEELVDASPLYRELVGHWLDPVAGSTARNPSGV